MDLKDCEHQIWGKTLPKALSSLQLPRPKPKKKSEKLSENRKILQRQWADLQSIVSCHFSIFLTRNVKIFKYFKQISSGLRKLPMF